MGVLTQSCYSPASGRISFEFSPRNACRGPGKRRSDDRRAAEEGQMTDEQFAFVMAIDQYKKQNNKPFPSWTEVLEIVKTLGYRKVAEPCSIDDLQQKNSQTTEE